MSRTATLFCDWLICVRVSGNRFEWDTSQTQFSEQMKHAAQGNLDSVFPAAISQFVAYNLGILTTGVKRWIATIRPFSPSHAAMCTQIEHVSNLAPATLTFGSSALWEG